MQFFFQELYSHIDKNSGKKFEDMFLVKIASKGTSLIAFELVNPLLYIYFPSFEYIIFVKDLTSTLQSSVVLWFRNLAISTNSSNVSKEIM